MLNINETMIDAIVDKVDAYIYVFHVGMGMRIMGADNGTLIITMCDQANTSWP
jgi:hypothetical protein